MYIQSSAFIATLLKLVARQKACRFEWSDSSYACITAQLLLQIVSLELSPAEFEEHVLGAKQDWRQSLLVEVEQQDQQECIKAVPLGLWLQQQGIQVDAQGWATGLCRFAREPLSGPVSHR